MNTNRITSLFGLEDRVAIITGATRGIGRSVAEGFVDAGATVVVVSRKADAVEVAETVHAFGGIDIVVNNAATALSQPLGSLTAEAWSKVNDVNLRGPVFLIEAVLPHLLASSHASVINVISAGAFLASPHRQCMRAPSRACSASRARWRRISPPAAYA